MFGGGFTGIGILLWSWWPNESVVARPHREELPAPAHVAAVGKDAGHLAVPRPAPRRRPRAREAEAPAPRREAGSRRRSAAAARSRAAVPAGVRARRAGRRSPRLPCRTRVRGQRR